MNTIAAKRLLRLLSPRLLTDMSSEIPGSNKPGTRTRSRPGPTLDSEPSSEPASGAGCVVEPVHQLRPIGWVRKADGRTTIELADQFRPGLLGVDALDWIWVLYWFDRNDTPAPRTTLQVHPLGDPQRPLRGVFATRAPMRPNPIALSRCRLLSVTGSVIEIEGIDAYADTPVLDIKP